MIFRKIPLKGAFIIELEKNADNRGFFSRTWCQKEFQAHGLNTNIAQCNLSFSAKKGTLRGIHYQIPPFDETRLVRCTRGAIYDVIIDLRPDSATYAQWVYTELTAENYKMLYVPENFAHGFQTLEDNTEITYQVSQFYTPDSERGIRWDDPAFNFKWPIEVQVISDKDKSWPDYEKINSL
jgi:dTDP-4-dehydrorhamnose 3,5-epimerase